MRLGSYQLGNSVGQCGIWADMEDWYRIFPFIHTTGREYD